MKKLSTLLLITTTCSLFTINLASATTDSAQPFSDVSSEATNAEAIMSLQNSGVVEGYSDDTYKPDLEMNRAEFIKILISSVTSTPKGSNCFDDVHNEWFAPYICEAKTRGIVQGDSANKKIFRPGDNINFSEAAKVIAKVYNLENGETDANIWYKEFVTAMENKQAIPLSVEFFDENITRGEMAEMVWRLKENVSDKATRTYDEISGDDIFTAKSCADIQNRFVTETMTNEDVLYYPETTMGGMITPLDTPSAINNEAAMTSTKSDSAPSDDYSSTNIQVEGVDEADVIKNDGKYIYILKGNTIRIVEAYPAENMKELVNFSFQDEGDEATFSPSQMYIDGDTLTVIGSTYSYYNYDYSNGQPDGKMSYMPIAPSTSRVKVYIVDISNHSKPSIERSVEFDGNYSESRRIGETLYLILNKSPYYYSPYYRQDFKDEEIKPRDILPVMLDSTIGKEELTAPCNQVKFLSQIPYHQPTQNFIIAAAIPLNDNHKAVKRDVIIGNSENIYASLDNLYVASTNWMGSYYYPYTQSPKTVIYKFALANDDITYQSQGKVPGTILNQFSMDEHNGNFRIATTKNEYGSSNEINNNLYILNDKMELTGKLENIAPGEKMYSVRFMGDRTYMVTFKRVDPLFVIDTKDPKNPKILGKLKIPGYSTYLHPYDENHIIGFGTEVDENVDADKVSSDDFIYYTAVQGMKIGVFDVTDVSHPKEMFKEVIGQHNTTSELFYNHKALLFDKEKELIAFPVTVYEYQNEGQCSTHTYSDCPSTCNQICVPSSCTYDNGIKICTADCDGENSCLEQQYQDSSPIFQGAYVYKFNLQDGFKLLGKITHLTNDQQTEMLKLGYWSDYQKTIERILYMGKNLYTVSQAVVKANDLETLKEKNTINLAGDTTELIHYPMPL